MSVPFHYIDLRAFSYATEDEARVEAALRRFLPEDAPIDRDVTEGHHGDRIVVLSTRVENAADLRAVLSAVEELEDIDRVVAEFDERIDEDCSLFLQFDKQAAYRDEIALGRGIMLRAKVEAYPARKAAAVENARGAFVE